MHTSLYTIDRFLIQVGGRGFQGDSAGTASEKEIQMGSQSREVRERQITSAESELAGLKEKLKKKGLKPDKIGKHASVRGMEAKIRRLRAALDRIAELEKQASELKLALQA